MAEILNTNENGNCANRMLATAYCFKQIEWAYFNPHKLSNSFQKIVAQANFELPKWITEKRDCSIDITLVNYSWTGEVYEATIWWFNRGIKIVNSSEGIKTISNCQELVNERIFELSTVFLGCC